MAKTLSAFNQTAIDNPTADVIRLLQIDFDGLSLYLCSRNWGEPGSENTFNGQLYEPLVNTWGDINCGKIDPITYQTSPSEAQVMLDNNTPIGGVARFVTLFATYDIHYATVTISEIFNGASAAEDEIDIFKGKVEDVIDMETSEITLACSGFELDIANKFAHEIVETDTFPNADPDDIGKMLPEAWGSAKRVPCRAIDVGALTTLSETVSSTATTFKLTDSSNFPSTGTILIDSEQVTYTGNAANSLTGCSRAANSTQAAKHIIGAKIGEVQSEYDYGIGNAVKAIDAVYVDDILQQSSVYTAYTGQTGDEHGTYTGRAVIEFASWPEIKRESVEGVYDVFRESTSTPIGRVKSLDKNGMILDYDTSTAITFQAAPTGTLTDIYVEYEFEFRHFGTPSGYFSFYLDGTLIACWRDGVFTQFVSSPLKVYKAAWPTSATKTSSYRGNGMTGTAFTVLSAKVYATSDTDDKGNRGKAGSIDSSNQPLGGITSETAVGAGTSLTFPSAPSGNLSDIEITYSWDFKLWGETVFSGNSWHVAIDGINVAWIGPDGSITALMPSSFTVCKDAWQTSITKTASRLDEFMHGYALTVSQATQSYFTDSYSEDIQLTGNSMADAVIGARVSVDVQGYQDDGSGTYTGTPSALIERPDHVFKHILIDRCGLTASEINATVYAASGALYSALSMTLNLALLERPNTRTVLGNLAYQSRSIQFWEAGVHQLVYMGPETADKTIEGNRINLSPPPKLDYTDRVDILNTFTGKYNYKWSGYDKDEDAYRDTVPEKSDSSIRKYGTLEGDSILFPSVSGSGHALRTLQWIRSSLAHPRLVIDFEGGFWFTDLERGDTVSFDITSGEDLDNAMAGLVESSTIFRVQDMKRGVTKILVTVVTEGVSVLDEWGDGDEWGPDT